LSHLLVTGFPGFLGSALLPRLLARSPEATAICLVQSRYGDLAQRRAEAIASEQPGTENRLRLVDGDIAQPGLGLRNAGAPLHDVTEIYHLAAVYDLSVDRESATRVNVDGTKRVLELAAGCPRLERLHYVSTCYVSGRHPGIFTEADLDVGQTFNNYYEETKFLAEVELQGRMKEGLPATIYRPAIVVGDSRTGETQKYDGPYFIIRWILRQPRIALVPVVGDPTATRVNVVPRDFVIDAIAYLSGLSNSSGKVYQLADPNPLAVDEIIREISRAANRRIIRLPLPLRLAKAATDRVPGVYWLTGIPSSAIDYFVHPTHYTSEVALADLEGSDISVPSLLSYLRNLIAFVERNPLIGSEAMT
jgi:thioester reductase-like protein